MKRKHYIIKLTENITVKEASGDITRNSNGTQWVDVELDGWKLGEGEKLYITFELENENPVLTTRVGALLLFYDKDTGRYVTQIPPEVLSVAAEWKYSIEKRFNIVDTEDGLDYNTITSSVETLLVTDSVMRASGTDAFVKETELIAAAENFESTRQEVAENRQFTEEALEEAQGVLRQTQTAQSVTEAARDEAVSAVRDAQFAYNNSVNKTTVAYRVSDSGTECPTGEWSETIPEAKAGQYLWTKTTYYFNDGTTKDAYSIGKMGNNGFYALTNGLFSFRVDDNSDLYCDFVDNGKQDSPKFRYDEETGNLFYIIDDNIPDNGTVIEPGTIYMGNLKGLPGTPGKDGLPGRPGDSAYVLAVKGGFIGTEQEWLNSLHGADGKNGADGAPGIDGIDGQDGTTILNIQTEKYENRGSYTDTTLKVVTNSGDMKFVVYARNGTDGTNGVGIQSVMINSAGELIIVPTVGEAINCGRVVGRDGVDGVNGADGKDGVDGVGIPGTKGDSAYEIAVKNGFTGTEQDWLNSLKGEPGAAGVGISNIVPDGQDANGGNVYIITLTDGSSYKFTAPKGDSGIASAQVYETTVSLGNDETFQVDFKVITAKGYSLSTYNQDPMILQEEFNAVLEILQDNGYVQGGNLLEATGFDWLRGTSSSSKFTIKKIAVGTESSRSNPVLVCYEATSEDSEEFLVTVPLCDIRSDRQYANPATRISILVRSRAIV